MDRGEPLHTRGMLHAGKVPSMRSAGQASSCYSLHSMDLWHEASSRLKGVQAVLSCSSPHTVLPAALVVSRHMCTHCE